MGRRVGRVRGAGRVVDGPLTLERDVEGATAVVVVVEEEARRRCKTWNCLEQMSFCSSRL